ncbi:sulfatase [Bacteroidota bacterium]
MKNFYIIILIPLFIACSDQNKLKEPGSGDQIPENPNIVILFADDMGYGDLSCYGNPVIKTPSLDKMASEGMRLTSFYVAAPVCTPSRAALLTGRYPFRSNLEFVLGPESTHGIADNEFTLAEGLKSKGYTTAIFGKWHLGHLNNHLPVFHGFDEYFGIPYSNDMKKPWVQTDYPLSLWENDQPVENPVDQDQLTVRYTKRAVEFIKKNKNSPFFLYLPYNMPHMPVHTSEDFRGKSRGGLYGDVIETIDWSAGEILKTLKEEGLEESTFFIFSSDNGPWSVVPERMVADGNERHHAGTAGLLNGSKATPFEGGNRVPAIFRFPGVIPPGQVSADIANTMDVYMTIMNLMDVELPGDMKFDGNDILPFLCGETPSPSNEMFYFRGNHLTGVRVGEWKLLINNQGKKPIEHSDLGEMKLYHLEKDPGERYDFSDKEPQVVEKLKNRLLEFDLEILNTDLARANN